MQSTPWIALLKKIPAEQHNHLVLVTEAGVEFTIQTILQSEGEWLAFKGRLACSQETGRLYFVPFDRIDYLGFNRSVAEEEFRSWFGNAPAPAQAAGGLANGKPGAGANGAQPNRAALLERIRARPSSGG